jgi:signal transduction histidine kinase
VAELAGTIAVCAVALACGALLALRTGVLAAGALAALLAVLDAGLVPLLLITLAPWTAGRLVRTRRELVAALAERNRQIEAEQAALAELAVRRERARIARELHDIVAHHLAVMVIHAGAGRLDAPDSAARFAGIRDSGREALGELDRLVELLHADDAALAGSGAGLGLAGMRERAEALGGMLDAGPQADGGWRLHARLPLATSLG